MTLIKKNFESPDLTKNPPNVKVDIIKIGEMTIERQTYQSGWRWSKDMKPLVGTDSCQMHHFGIWISGRIKVRADDGQEVEYGPGDVSDIPPGHDGWTIGDEPAVFYAFTCLSAKK